MIISLKGLRLDTILGVHEHERLAKRPVVIDVEIEGDLSNAEISDEICDTIDYKAVRDRIIAVVEAAEYRLVEALAHAVLHAIVIDPRVQRVRLEVGKPGALRRTDSISVVTTWRREPSKPGTQKTNIERDLLLTR